MPVDPKLVEVLGNLALAAFKQAMSNQGHAAAPGGAQSFPPMSFPPMSFPPMPYPPMPYPPVLFPPMPPVQPFPADMFGGPAPWPAFGYPTFW
jgi:hypothetical protein